MFQPSWWSKAISSHRKNVDILRLKNIAPYKECKGTLKDVQLKRSPDTVSTHTSQSSSHHNTLISKVSFTIWNLKIQTLNISQKNLFEALATQEESNWEETEDV